MSWVSIVKALLQLAVFLVGKANDQQQQQIGRDEEIKDALAQLATSTGMARSIDLAAAGWTDADIEQRLHTHFRDDPTGATTEAEPVTKGDSGS